MKNLLYSTTLALFAMALTTPAVHADCGISDRVAYDDSFCLDADLDDNDGNFLEMSRWDLENICTGYDNTLKFKVDLESHSDFTHTVNDGDTASGSARANIRQVSCCKDSAAEIGPYDTNLCEVETKDDYKQAVWLECRRISGPLPANCDFDDLDDLRTWMDEF